MEAALACFARRAAKFCGGNGAKSLLCGPCKRGKTSPQVDLEPVTWPTQPHFEVYIAFHAPHAKGLTDSWQKSTTANLALTPHVAVQLEHT